MCIRRIFRLIDWRNKIIGHTDSFSVYRKYLWLLCTILLFLTATAFAAPILKQGSEGHDVLVLQQNLKKLGYFVEPDGVFDTTTFNAVVAFQREENLPSTGIVDRVTWHALQSKASQKADADEAERGQTSASQEALPPATSSEPPTAQQNVLPTVDATESSNEKEPIQESAPPSDHEGKNTSTIHPQPATLPSPGKDSTQKPQTSIHETKSPKPETQAPPATSTPIQKPSSKLDPKQEEPKTETKESKTSLKVEKVPEQAPFLPKGKVDAIIKTAKKYTGTKYVFGGTTPKGFDCSGFVQYVFKQNGFSLPRTADEQYKLGKGVKKRAELEPGDLVFFSTYEKGASHCGIYLGKNQFIHVSSSKGVRVDSLDDSYWKPRWYGGKHIVKK